MKIEIDIDDDYLREHSKLAHPYELLAENYILDWIEIGIRPCYDDGMEVYWIQPWLDPDKDTSPHKICVIEGVKI
mgnify:CR=1 FL=1